MSSVQAMSSYLPDLGEMEKLPCKNTFDMTVHIVISAVKEKLKNGQVTLADLDEIESALTVENNKVEAFCHSVHERCMAKSKLDLLVPPRTNAYGRIMVQPLEKLMDKKHRHLSEKQLPNYFHMLSVVLGRTTYEIFHDTIADLMRDEIRDHGSHFTWEAFYQHPKVVQCRLETLGAIAQSFEHFEKRLNWFVTVMEGNVTDLEHAHGTMQFTEHQAQKFLLALFDECIEMSPEQKENIERYLPERQRSDIAHLTTRLLQM